jgi:hypothetical protein
MLNIFGEKELRGTSRATHPMYLIRLVKALGGTEYLSVIQKFQTSVNMMKIVLRYQLGLTIIPFFLHDFRDGKM